MKDFVYHILNQLPYGFVAVLLIGLFAILYFTLTSSLYLFFKYTLKMGWTEKVSSIEMFKNQIQFEIKHSLISIIVFGLYGLLIVFCYRNGLVSIAFENNYMILVDLLILAVWNEFHFYLGHKLMHTKAFISMHRTHHKSVVVTPFTTYSFHPVESIILGSVMILPMFVIELEVLALIIFPVYSLLFNSLGHSNVKLRRKTAGVQNLKVSTQHNNHHTKFNSNLGFASSLLDKAFRTNFKKSV